MPVVSCINPDAWQNSDWNREAKEHADQKFEAFSLATNCIARLDTRTVQPVIAFEEKQVNSSAALQRISEEEQRGSRHGRSLGY
jgi:hypothetical protein